MERYHNIYYKFCKEDSLESGWLDRYRVFHKSKLKEIERVLIRKLRKIRRKGEIF
ncbi:MAG: hypothetical protein QF567_01230 [Candidatus Pacearchaeota archaeon]|jgi:hypothetical protein|nr:hypothetical protein [Candidatus Pacearchaeota archaeon]|tara:strand:+ start:4136 stop:4300 length:165 start_codon:yes stop_codon:yes gene_type:complete